MHEDIAGSSVDTAHEVVDSDDEKAGSSVWEVRTSQTEATFIHTREMCPFHLFALEAKESAMKSVSAHGMNHLHCVKCYCYVCDAPASEPFLGVGPNVTRLEAQGPEPQVLNQALGRTIMLCRKRRPVAFPIPKPSWKMM